MIKTVQWKGPTQEDFNKIRARGIQVGKDNEDEMFQAIDTYFPNKKLRPPWLYCIRRPTAHEDIYDGADLVALTTDAGRIYVQVKSSLVGVDKFKHIARVKEIRYGVEVVVLSPSMKHKLIVKTIYKAIATAREKIFSQQRRLRELYDAA